jgi:hypothetical protein
MMQPTRYCRAIIALLALSVLAACSGGNSETTTQTAGVIELREAFRAQRASKEATAKAPTVTRALVEQINAPIVEVRLDSRDVTGYFLLSSQRGDVQLWNATDGGQIVIRSGLVTATRGIRDDLASSDFADTLDRLQAGSGSSSRRYYVRNALGGQDMIRMECNLSNSGPERLEILERFHDTIRLRETCRAQDGTEIENAYWIEPKSGIIRQSRQWISPDLGHFFLRFLAL